MYRPFLKLEEGNVTAREPRGPMRVRQIHNFLGKHRQIERKFNSNESSDPSNQELLSLCLCHNEILIRDKNGFKSNQRIGEGKCVNDNAA